MSVGRTPNLAWGVTYMHAVVACCAAKVMEPASSSYVYSDGLTRNCFLSLE